MNAHVNLAALRRARPAGKAGVESAPTTLHKSPAEEGMITAEFAVALPAVTVVLALCLGAASTGGCAAQSGGVRANGRAIRRPRRFRGADSLRRQPHRPGAERADFCFS